MRFYEVNGQDVSIVELVNAWLAKQADDKKHREQMARSKEFGIEPKEGGRLTPPPDFPSDMAMYGDPVNYRYPADESHAKPALSYFNQTGQMEAGGYTPAEWKIIGQRLAGLISRHLQADYEFVDGKLRQKTQKTVTVEIIAKQARKQIAYGVILRPDKADADGDIYTAEEVEKAAHTYMADYAGAADWLHREALDRQEAVMVESFIAPLTFDWDGFPVLKGDWIGGMLIKNKERWARVEAGEINAFSINGYGQRTPLDIMS